MKKSYSQAVDTVKTIKKTMIKSNVYTEKEVNSAGAAMNMLLQELYGIGVFEVEKDTEL